MGKHIESENLSDMVRTEMERDLIAGRLQPGTVLDERSLAERFGVSRTPVREAVLQMAALELEQNLQQQAEENPDISRKYSKFKEFYIDD